MTGPQNGEPTAADGSHGANAAKNVLPGKGVNPAKRTSSAKKTAPGATIPAAAPKGGEAELAPAQIVVRALSGDASIDRMALSAPVQTLLLIAELERRRKELFDDDGIYTGESFSGVIREILPGIGSSRLNTVVKYLRRLGATVSIERGGKPAIKFKGTSEADAIVLALDEHGSAAPSAPATGGDTKPVPNEPGDHGTLQLLGDVSSNGTAPSTSQVVMFAGHALPTAMAGAEAHADTIVATVMQAAGYNLGIAAMVAERLGLIVAKR